MARRFEAPGPPFRKKIGPSGAALRLVLPVLVDPTPPLPWTDEADLASDATRPLVFYQVTSEPVIRPVKDAAENSIRVER